MGGMMLVRSLCRSFRRRSHVFPFSVGGAAISVHARHIHFSDSSFRVSSPGVFPSDRLRPFAAGIGATRFFSKDVSHMPGIDDLEVKRAFKDLMAADWDELPLAVVEDVKKALSKTTEDKNAQVVLKNVFVAAEAVEEFTGTLVSLKMEMDDIIGMSGENVQALPDELVKALQVVFDRYNAYLVAFGPEESYLKKKVETELGTKMIYLKMRCSGLNAEWGKVTVLGTSGISGSYIEQRA